MAHLEGAVLVTEGSGVVPELGHETVATHRFRRVGLLQPLHGENEPAVSIE